MKTAGKWISLAAAVLAFVAIVGSRTVMAAQTPPCTAISNQASVDYQVGGVDQDPVDSDDNGNSADGINPTVFNVGVKVIVTVDNSDDANVTVTPSTSGTSYLTFTVANSGNATHDYLLSLLDTVGAASYTATPDDFSLLTNPEDDTAASEVEVYLEDGTTLDFQSAEDTLLTAPYTIDNLASDDTATIYVVYQPGSLKAVKDQVAVDYLKALTKWANGDPLPAACVPGGNCTDTVTDGMVGGTACTAGGTSVDIVLGDGDGDGGGGDDAGRDGAHLDKGAFVVANAVITMNKTKAVYSDPINGTPGKAIPGAVVTYTIEVENTGNADASGVSIEDNLSGEIANLDFGNLDTDYSANGSFVDATDDCDASAGYGVVVTDGVAAATAVCKTDANDVEVGPDAYWNAGTSILTVNNLTVAAGETATVKFQVTLK